MRVIAALLLISSPLWGDVLILKDGTRVSGSITKKPKHYEVATEGGLRTFLAEEVDRVATSPKELLGDADALYEEAKRDFEKAVELKAEDTNPAFKEALAKATKVRQAYAVARELFPDDKYTELDKKLLQIMQLIRLVRERMHTEAAVNPEAAPAAPAAPAAKSDVKPVDPMQSALGVLADPTLRADTARRKEAREVFMAARGSAAGDTDHLSAAVAFLSRSDVDWGLGAPALKGLQDYFEKSWFKSGATLNPAGHLEAARFLSDRLSEIRKSQANAPLEALAIFAAAHLACAVPGAETEKVAGSLGLSIQDGVLGTAEGFAVRDLNRWIWAGDHDLALIAFRNKYRETANTAAVRFVWSWAMLRLVHQRNHGYDRAVAALDSIPNPDGPLRNLAAALTKSIKAWAPCGSCDGLGRYRCTFCHGKMAEKTPCTACQGRGYHQLSATDKAAIRDCDPCKATGFSKTVLCEKCSRSYLKCSKCERPRAQPRLTDICATSLCSTCGGRGQLFARTAWPCRSCQGVGLLISPNPSAPPPPKPVNPNEVDLLQLIHPIRDTIRGQWRLEGDALVSPADIKSATLQVNYAPPEEYDVRIVASKRAGNHALIIGLAVGERQFGVVLDCFSGDVTAVDRVDGKAGIEVSESSRKGKVFKDDKPVTILVSVRKDRLTVTANGQGLIDWKADYRRVAPYFSTPNKRAMLLGSFETSYLISEATLVSVKGKGQKLRP